MPVLRPRRLPTFAVVGFLLTLVAMMGVAVSYSVTLYRLFCSVTGAGGTTQRAAENDTVRSPRMVRVFFSTNVAPNLPWRFVPVQPSVDIHLGDDAPVLFEAENLSDHDIVGHATFNVTPDKAGIYFKKIECFCFTEERLEAHHKVRMPVVFFVDPALATDPATADVDQITLSYTFFQSLQPDRAADLARLAVAAPGGAVAGDPAAGEREFATQCAACHALDSNRVGPALDHVVGRRAGSLPGYPYSRALAQSGLVWTADTLDQWLSGPRRFLPGALMPMAVVDPAVRADIIAYLVRQSGQRGAVLRTAGPAPG